MINVTKPFLPPIDEYIDVLNGIWERGWLTNQGPCVLELENKLEKYLDINHLNYVTNGTIAIQLAMQALEIDEGEIITTPFSYIATTSTILLEKCKPVFVDINPNTLQIDENLIEEKITDKTRAILAVHVFGLPCNIEKIEYIAKKYNLKVIYDAAHAFGTKYNGKSLLSYGDISTCSFHATKLFHTVEGGSVIANNKELHEKVSLMKRFGHNGDDHLTLGTNAKSSELHAAMGLVNLKYIDNIISERKRVSDRYDNLLKNYVETPYKPENLSYNYAYYPVILKSENVLLKVIDELNKYDIFPRRYFYPSLDTISYVEAASDCEISQDISKRIMCLPLYPELKNEEVDMISNIIIEVLK